MAENRWEERYRNEETGWDAGAPAPALVEWVQNNTGRFSHAVAPGVGRGYDLFELAKVAERVTGLDLAPSTRAAFEEMSPPEHTSLVVADFFDHRFEADLVWDYTFLCAIDPSERERWAATMASSISEGGTLLILVFPIDPNWGDDGPPFRLDPEEVHTLLDSAFERVSLTKPSASHPNREGLELLAEYRRK